VQETLLSSSGLCAKEVTLGRSM